MAKNTSGAGAPPAPDAGEANGPTTDVNVPSTTDVTVPEPDAVRLFTAASPTVFRRRLVGIGGRLELTRTEHGAFVAADVVAAPWGD